ncbi:E3 ubiquitin-protein ligase TRIM39-like [Colossoma macropomum]|uniref:E3 ubiquitin-protein ligase TRIM39-like n=1 Tax=Colossoma macropomum TaxID=42526 RepID=UPI00186464BE|nr:E3 ubiquitin-protein ligase TRIM39-like [Colossoma macropomum]
MASSSGVVSEEQLLCCICLDVFTDPVSTSCGHNFCKKCLGGYWDNSDHWHCPLCNKSFENRPDLSVNTFISETAAQFRKSAELNASSSAEDSPSKLTKVLCDACTGVKKKAVKFCLNCGASYCGTHLEPHKNIQILQKHKFIDPVENLQDYICKKHERPLELFCRDDQTCVCLFCTVTDHKSHNTVPIEEESGELKAQLKKTQIEVQKRIQDRLEKTEEIKQSLELSKKSTEDEIAGGVEVFTALICSIERRQAELLGVMEEEQKAAERQAEHLIKELEQEITELKRRDTELEQLSHTEDHLHLLQISPSLCRPPHTNNWTDISLNTNSSVEILRRSLSQLQKTINNETEKEIQKLKQRKQKEATAFKWFIKNWTQLVLLLPLLPLVFLMLMSNKMWIQFYAVDVTLDPDTANRFLILSDDGKQLRCTNLPRNVLYSSKRFFSEPYVLAKEGFSSGRFYYEVQVGDKTDWVIGVAEESVDRFEEFPDGTWTIALWNSNKYKACEGSCKSLSMRKKPQKVGVFVDYEEGLVSFYDVEARSHIYTFTGQSFTKKLYPFLSPCHVLLEHGNSAPLIISKEYQSYTWTVFQKIGLF